MCWRVSENAKDTNGWWQRTCYPIQTGRLVKHGKTTALLDPINPQPRVIWVTYCRERDSESERESKIEKLRE